MPQTLWEPAKLLETTIGSGLSVSGSSLAANGDIWEVLLAPPSAMPDYIFYPIALTATLFSAPHDVAFASFWNTACGVAINPSYQKSFVWDHFVAEPPMVGYSTTEFNYQSLNPPFHGHPIRPAAADGATVTINALGGFQLTIDTWDAGVAATTTLFIDARWLAFPRAVARSSGFYVPRLYFDIN